jgi:mycofactocin precursor
MLTDHVEHRDPESLQHPEPAATETIDPVPSDAELVLDDLLVEDVSIDGMCGVY